LFGGTVLAEDYRILVVSPHYFSFTKGLTEATAKSVTRMEVILYHNRWTELSRLVPAVGDTLPRARRNTLGELIDNEGTPGNVGIHIANGYFGTFDRKNVAYGEKMFACMKRTIESKGIKFDLVHGHFVWPWGYVASKISQEFKVPLVITAHGHDIYDVPFINDEWRKRTEGILNSASYVTTVSNNNLACMKRLDVRTRAQVIPNGYNDAVFHPMDRIECRKRLDLPIDRKIILTAGRLSPEKGQKCLIESVGEIVLKRKDLICIIIGTGGLKSDLQRTIKLKGLNDSVLLVGGKPHNEIPLWMNSCDAFILPSLMEGNPTVMFEALGCGIPFIGTSVGGVPDIITSDEYGSLCLANDSHGLAEIILAALDKDWKRDRILEYSKNYTWDAIAAQIIPIYKTCLRSAR